MTTEQHERYMQDRHAGSSTMPSYRGGTPAREGRCPPQHAGDADLDQMREEDLDRLFDDTVQE
jgi:hypothetical protein